MKHRIPVIVATTTDKEDDEIAKLCQKLEIPFYRGSRENVLSRFYECARQFNLDVIIRACSDCPLINYEAVDELIETYKQNPEADLIHDKHLKGNIYGTGAELVTFKALEKVYQAANTDFYKEHVLPYIYERPDQFQIIKISASKETQRPNYFLTLDYSQDLDLIESIIDKIKTRPKTAASPQEIINILDINPNLLKINADLHEPFPK